MGIGRRRMSHLARKVEAGILAKPRRLYCRISFTEPPDAMKNRKAVKAFLGAVLAPRPQSLTEKVAGFHCESSSGRFKIFTDIYLSRMSYSP